MMALTLARPMWGAAPASRAPARPSVPATRPSSVNTGKLRYVPLFQHFRSFPLMPLVILLGHHVREGRWVDTVDVESRGCRRLDLPGWVGRWMDPPEPYELAVPEHLRLIGRRFAHRYHNHSLPYLSLPPTFTNYLTNSRLLCIAPCTLPRQNISILVSFSISSPVS